MTRDLAVMHNVAPRMEDIVTCIIPFSSKSTAWSVIARSVVAAFAYYVWQERNNRLFQKQSRRVEQLRVVIYATVRLKLMSLRFKNSASVVRSLEA